MSSLDRLEGLARLACKDSPPDIDVVGRVLDRVRGTRPAEVRARFWPLALGVAAAAAASVCIATYTLMGFQEPFIELLSSARAVFI
jgi:hypothetical protein